MPDAAATPHRWAGSPPNGWQVLRRNRVAMLCFWYLLGVALTAIFVPAFLPAEVKMVSESSYVPPSWCDGGMSRHLLARM